MKKLCKDLLPTGCTKKWIKDIFEESELRTMETNKRKINNKNIGHKLTMEEMIESVDLATRDNQVKTGRA